MRGISADSASNHRAMPLEARSCRQVALRRTSEHPHARIDLHFDTCSISMAALAQTLVQPAAAL